MTERKMFGTRENTTRAKRNRRETWQDLVRAETPARDRVENLPPHLRGPPQNRFGGHQVSKMKPLPNSTFGPASSGRNLARDEVARIEDELRRSGILRSS